MTFRGVIILGVAILLAADPSFAQRGRSRASGQPVAAPSISGPVSTPSSGSVFVDGEPLPPAKPAAAGPCTMSLAGSVWEGNTVWKGGERVNWWTQFRGDGVMVYAYRGSTYDNGRWRQDGTSVALDTNDHYADYDGAMTLTSMNGSSRNVAGDAGVWRMKRDCVDAPVS